MPMSAMSKLVRPLLRTKGVLSCKTRHQSLWTSDNVVHSPFQDVDIPNATLGEYIWENADRWADKTATVCGFTGRQYTYAQLHKYSKNFATRLRTHFRIRDGDFVCVMMPNLPEFPLAVIGSSQAGAIVTPTNPVYTSHEVAKQLLHSKPKIIITIPESLNTIKQAQELAKINIPIITVLANGEATPDGAISFDELIKGDIVDTSVLKDVNVKPSDICLLPYSSGTTGLPKGVQLTHRNIVANFCQQEEKRIRQYQETTADYQDNVLVVLPQFHIYGLNMLTLHKLSVGAKLVTVPKFQANTFLDVLDRHKISVFYAAPPIVLFLGSHAGVRPEHFSGVHMFMSAAAPLPLADAEKLFDKAQRKFDLLQGYGLTETSPLATAMTRNSGNHATVGYAIANTRMKIIDSDKKHLGPDKVGELCVQGPQIMKGYKDNEASTRECLSEDGWFRTGDLARISEDGCLYIHDRLKELIKVKGFQVPPAELEGVLKEHPDVFDAAVLGVPHNRFGEVPKAFLVGKPGVQLDIDNVKAFVAERVAEYKRLHDVVVLDCLPKTPSGKILKRVLKEKYC